MIRNRPPTASAAPATIFRALAILNSGISEAANQIPAMSISRKPTSAITTPVW